jgi:hypothetical protein
LAEIPPDPKKYPGASPHMLYAGSLVFTPPHRPVDLKNFGEWWYFKNFEQGSQWARKAVEHLKYNMGSSLISSIVADMIHDGPREKYANGGPCVDGLIVGSVTELADQIKYYRGEMLRVA